jgi:hypothetical protein
MVTAAGRRVVVTAREGRGGQSFTDAAHVEIPYYRLTAFPRKIDLATPLPDLRIKLAPSRPSCAASFARTFRRRLAVEMAQQMRSIIRDSSGQ